MLFEAFRFSRLGKREKVTRCSAARFCSLAKQKWRNFLLLAGEQASVNRE